MVIPNMVMKLKNDDIFYQICYILDLLSALDCRVVSVKNINPHHMATGLYNAKSVTMRQILNHYQH